MGERRGQGCLYRMATTVLRYIHSTEDETVFIGMVVTDDNIVVEYTHLEHGVVCTDAEI